MEGLEVKEVLFSQLTLDNEKLRIDDEFFLKKYLAAYQLIKTKPHILFGNVISILSDYHANGSYEILKSQVELLDRPDFAYMVRSTDLEKNDFISDSKYVTQKAYECLSKTKLFGGEILINKIGRPGRTYLMPILDIPATVGMNLFMVRLDKKSGFRERFVWAFLNSELGQKIIYRKVNGTVPLTIDKDAIRTLYLPIFSDNIQLVIDKIVIDSANLLSQSKEEYAKAETLLLQTLGLDNFSPSTEKVNIKSFKDSFCTSGRLDAEYYQIKYEEMIDHITSQHYAKLSSLVSIEKSIEPGSDAYTEDDEEGLPFLRVADYSKFGLTKPQKQLKQSFVNANSKLIKKLIPKANTILFSKDGSVGEAYCLRQDADFITSGAILHLKINESTQVLPDYLTLVLNSKLVKMQSERDAGGSIILHWRVGEIEEVVVPLVDMAIQQQIAQSVQQSFTLKAQSEHLLEVAKRAVEIAIEQDEQTAIDYMNEQTQGVFCD